MELQAASTSMVEDHHEDIRHDEHHYEDHLEDHEDHHEAQQSVLHILCYLLFEIFLDIQYIPLIFPLYMKMNTIRVYLTRVLCDCVSLMVFI